MVGLCRYQMKGLVVKDKKLSLGGGTLQPSVG
jgi:hypothetical protein